MITGVVLRIHRRAEARLFAAFRMPSIDSAFAAVYLALREEVRPAGLRLYDAAEARAHFAGELAAIGDGLDDDEALLLAATAGPTDLAVCDRELIASAVAAEGGQGSDVRLADAWWKLRGGDPRQVTPPSFQITATPRGSARSTTRCAAPRARWAPPRAHISRFDADGAVLFFTLVAPGSGGRPLEGARLDEARTACEEAARGAGGWLLGPRSVQLDPYLSALRAALDPRGIMNPGALGGG